MVWLYRDIFYKKAQVPVLGPWISCKPGCRDRLLYPGSQLIHGPGTSTWSPVLEKNRMRGAFQRSCKYALDRVDGRDLMGWQILWSKFPLYDCFVFVDLYPQFSLYEQIFHDDIFIGKFIGRKRVILFTVNEVGKIEYLLNLLEIFRNLIFRNIKVRHQKVQLVGYILKKKLYHLNLVVAMW